MKIYAKSLIVIISFLFVISCNGVFMPNLSDELAAKTGNELISVDYGLEVVYEFRDTNQNLIVYLTKNNLPVRETVIPQFTLSEGAMVFPVDPNYFYSFIQENPQLEIGYHNFVSPNSIWGSFKSILIDALDKGQTVTIPSIGETVISTYNKSYDYLVVSESGLAEMYKVCLAEPSNSGAEILVVSVPAYMNSSKINDDIIPILDNNDLEISGVIQSGTDNNLIPYFVLSPGATMTINGIPFTPDNGNSINFDAEVEIVVTSKNGYFSNTYTMRLVEVNIDSALSSLVISNADNINLDNSIKPILNNDGTTFTASVPYGTNLSDLTAWADISPGAEISVNGVPFISGETVLDYSNPVTFCVTSEYGSNTSFYTLVIKEEIDQCELIDFSFELNSNSNLTDAPVVSINKSLGKIVVRIVDEWQPLIFNYEVSPGATINNFIDSDTGQLSTAESSLLITAADGLTTKEYLISVVSQEPVTIPNPIYVSPNGSGGGTNWQDSTSLQEALNLASLSIDPIDIWLKEGLYSPGLNRYDCFDIPYYTSLYGGFSGIEEYISERNSELHETIISGDVLQDDLIEIGAISFISENNYNLIKLNWGKNTIDGITLSSSWSTALVANADDINIVNCKIETSFKGKLFYFDECKNILIRNTKLSDGGITSFGGNAASMFEHCENVTVEQSEVSGNDGNIYFRNCDNVSISDTIFLDNFSSGAGGLSIYGSSNVNIDSCTFTDNMAFYGGAGGATFYSVENIIVENCLFTNNISHGEAGAIIIYECIDITLRSIDIANNISDRNGYSYYTEYPECGGGMLISRTPDISLEQVHFNNNECKVLQYSYDSKYLGHQLAIDYGDGAIVPIDLSGCTFSGTASGDQIGYFSSGIWYTLVQ